MREPPFGAAHGTGAPFSMIEESSTLFGNPLRSGASSPTLHLLVALQLVWMHGSRQRYDRLLFDVSRHRLPHVCRVGCSRPPARPPASASARARHGRREPSSHPTRHHQLNAHEQTVRTHRTRPPPPNSTVSLACTQSIRTAFPRPHTINSRHQVMHCNSSSRCEHRLTCSYIPIATLLDTRTNRSTKYPRCLRTLKHGGGVSATGRAPLDLAYVLCSMCAAGSASTEGKTSEARTHILSVTSSNKSMSFPASCCLRNSGATYSPASGCAKSQLRPTSQCLHFNRTPRASCGASSGAEINVPTPQ